MLFRDWSNRVTYESTASETLKVAKHQLFDPGQMREDKCNRNLIFACWTLANFKKGWRAVAMHRTCFGHQWIEKGPVCNKGWLIGFAKWVSQEVWGRVIYFTDVVWSKELGEILLKPILRRLCWHSRRIFQLTSNGWVNVDLQQQLHCIVKVAEFLPLVH